MNEAVRFDITINPGADYAIDFQPIEDDETPISVSGWSADAQLREFPESMDHIDFTCTSDSTGFHLTLSKDETAKIPYTRGYYDVFITDPDNGRTRLVHGRAIVRPRATR